MSPPGKLFGRDAADLDTIESGLSAADRRAIAEDFATADAVEPGLGAAIARFILAGEGEAVLLRIDAVLKGGGEPAELLEPSLRKPRRKPRGWKIDDEAFARLRVRRRRILVELEGFDVAAMRRLGLVLARRTDHIWDYGTDRTPAWLRRLLGAVDEIRTPADSALPAFSASRLREMLALEGLCAAPLVDLYFGAPLFCRPGQPLPDDLAAILEPDADAVCAEMLHLAPENRGTFMSYLAARGLLDRVPAIYERVFAAAGATAKATRVPAIGALLKVNRPRLSARAAAALGASSADERLAGVNVIGALAGETALAALEAHLPSERSRKVLQAIEALRPQLALRQAATDTTEADDAQGYTAIDGSRVVAPPRRDTADTIPADTAAVLMDLMTTANGASKADFDKPLFHEDWYLKDRGAYARPFDPKAIPALIEHMKGGTPKLAPETVRRAMSANAYHFPRSGAAYLSGLRGLFARSDFGTRALARLLSRDERAFALEFRHVVGGWVAADMPVVAELARRVASGADVREIVEELDACGQPAGVLARLLVETVPDFTREHADPQNPTLWTLLAAHLDCVDAAIVDWSAQRLGKAHRLVLGLCAAFPKPPLRYLPQLLDASIAGSGAARKQLEGGGDLLPVIAPLLKAGASGKRAQAARWLGDRKETAAIPHLRSALAAEKTLQAKAAILAALAACGDDISSEFAEDRLLAEAERELPKLEVDYSAFMTAPPALRWADGRFVDACLVAYWFARAHKLRQPAGDPMLALVLERLDRADAAAMGRDILSTFIRIDTHKATSDEANAYAEAGADQRVKTIRRWNKDYTRERAFDELRRDKLGEYLGSALDHRGLLALARLAPAGEAVAMVKRYLKDHGKRANQCRALLEMLAADPIPQKLQLILTIARRHKQPGTREYAGELAAAVAEARGWTAAELADRTVPTLDLDAAGTLTIEIGERAFRLCLTDDLTLLIENPNGKAIAALPSPKNPDEAAAAKATKKLVSATRKELRQTVEAQIARLYEAMCVERRWAVSDFSAYFLAHPILSRLVRRLVLTGHDAQGARVASMRLLEDGTLSDHDDASVALDGFTEIGIAHRATLGEAAAEAWRAHLADYDVTPLFTQVDRAPMPVPDAEATSVADRRGHAIDSFKLRAVAAKRGYRPGGVMDASYAAYEKSFAELGLAASIQFSGGFVGDTRTHTAAIHDLRFVRVRGGKPSQMGVEGIELAKVPPILLQEAWSDYHAIAAAGTGFDPNWKNLGLW